MALMGALRVAASTTKNEGWYIVEPPRSRDTNVTRVEHGLQIKKRWLLRIRGNV